MPGDIINEFPCSLKQELLPTEFFGLIFEGFFKQVLN